MWQCISVMIIRRYLSQNDDKRWQVEPDEREININGIREVVGREAGDGGCTTEGGKGILLLRQAAAESWLHRILPATLAKTTDNVVVSVAAGSTQWSPSCLLSPAFRLLSVRPPPFGSCPFRDRCPRLVCGRAYSTLNGESIIKVTVQWLRDRVPGQDVGEGESSYVRRIRCEHDSSGSLMWDSRLTG